MCSLKYSVIFFLQKPQKLVGVSRLLEQLLDQTVRVRLERLAEVEEDDLHGLHRRPAHLRPQVLDRLQRHVPHCLGLGLKHLSRRIAIKVLKLKEYY